MSHPAINLETRGPRQAAADEAVAVLVGAGFTLALFIGMAHFENFGDATPAPAIAELRMVAMPLEPPPPLPSVEAEAAPDIPPLSGIEIAAADSPVAIGVVPPDLELRIMSTPEPPRARSLGNLLHSELKPKAGIESDPRHIYQQAEVDQRPRSLVRAVPPIPPDVRGKASTLRVNLIMLIGMNGQPENVRVAETSGNSAFDAIVAKTVLNEWRFSPAIRRGKKVRVLVEQAFRINFSGGGSPMEARTR